MNKLVIKTLLHRLGLLSIAYRANLRLKAADPRTRLLNSKYLSLASTDGLPLPPPELNFLVTGTADISAFLEGGQRATASIRDVLEKNGQKVEKFSSILDFGCGCGRVLRHWAGLTETRVCGTDYNPRLIAWCTEHLKFADFGMNGLQLCLIL